MSEPGNPARYPVPKHIELHPGLLTMMQIGTLAAYLAILGGSLLAWNNHFFSAVGIYLDGSAGVAIVIVHLGFSLWNGYVGPQSIGAAYCYGFALQQFSSGPHFAPWGLVQVLTRTTHLQQWVFPADEDDIFYGDEKEELPPGKVRQLFITTKAPEGDESELLDVQMTLSVFFIVQYYITNIFDFIARFGSEEEARKDVYEIAVPCLAEDIRTRTVGGVIKDLPDISEKLSETIQERTRDWAGIDFVSARMTSPNLSHDLNRALRDIPKARAEKLSTVTASEGTRERLANEGEGQAYARKAMLFAEAEGAAKKAELLKISGLQAYAGEVAVDAVQKGNVVIVGQQGVSDLVGLAVASAKALEQGKQNRSTNGDTP